MTVSGSSGSNPSEPELDIARQRISDRRVEFVRGRAQDLPDVVADAQVVLMCNVIHQIPKAERSELFGRVWRALKPGGVFAFNTLYYEGAVVPETRPFYSTWLLKAFESLRDKGIHATPTRRQRPPAFQQLTAGQHRELLRAAGFDDPLLEEPVFEWSLEDWQALTRYSVFIKNTLGDIDLETGSEVLGSGVAAAFEALRLETVPRRWLHVVARKPRDAAWSRGPAAPASAPASSDAEIRRLTDKYEIGNMPGYLSYPTVSKWEQPVTVREVIDVSNATARARDSFLYFHFPYCESLCYYCACYMKVTANPKERYDEYIRGIEQELELKLRECGTITAGEMHWGGGTPTYMDCDQIERAFRIIERRVRFTEGANLSIEAYPDARTLSDEKLELLRSLGFSQVSFGIESLDPVVLKAINRRHDIASIRHWVDKARALGFGVHVNLVYGLPHQTEDSLRSTVEQVMSIEPDRLATFLFMYTPSTVQHQKVIRHEWVPDSPARFRLYQLLQQVGELGYTRVGCDHWVRGDQDPLGIAGRAGEIIYHFQGYEPLSRENFLGFGSSAISFAQNRYFQNTQDLKGYLAAVAGGTIPIIENRSHTLDADDQIRHFVIMKNVMSDLAIDKDVVEQRFGVVFDDHFAAELAQLKEMEADGLVEGIAGRRIVLTPLGCIFIRNIARVFDDYFVARQPAHGALRVLGDGARPR